VRLATTQTRSRRAMAVAALACLATPVLAHAARPHGAPQHRAHRQTLEAYSLRYDTPVAPGVQLSGFTSAARGGSVDSNVVTVDLSVPGVSTGVLVGRVTDTAPVSALAARQGAVAAVNGDYYAIGGSRAPQGPVVRDGELLKGTAAGQYLAGVGVDGIARLARVFLAGAASWGGGPERPLDSYNSDLYAPTLPPDAVAVLDGGWGDRPLTFVGAPRRTGIVAVDAHGRVLATWRRSAGQRVPAGGLLLIGTGQWASVAGLPKGSRVTRRAGMTTDAPVPFRWGLGVGLQLVSGGVVTHHYKDDSDPHAARTTLGWKDGGRTLLVVTAERAAGSTGQGVNEVADELAALGATDAVLLDGGGSTTLVARPQGDNAPGLVGAPQDGFQRPVPVGIGVFVPRGSHRLLGLQPMLDAGTVFPGLHRRASFRGWDEWFGPAPVDPATVALTSDDPGFALGDRPGLVRALRPGTGHVVATAPATAPGALGPASGSVFLRVLQPLRRLEAPRELRLEPGSSTSFAMTGDDGEESAVVDAVDLTPQTDSRYVTVGAEPDGRVRLTAKPGTEGGVSTVTLRSGGVAAKVLVRNGFLNVPLRDLGEAGAFRVTGGKGRVVPLGVGRRGLRIEPGKGRAAVAAAATPVPLPPGAQRVALHVAGDGLPHEVRLVLADAAGAQQSLVLGRTTAKGRRRLEIALSAGAVSVVAVEVTSDTGRGFVLLDGLVARV